jgi:hypothetical protein
MRTKTLLAAAVLAAGLATSMAQSNVYSQNVVGYINLNLPTGFTIVANQLDLDGTGTNNTVNSVFSTNLPSGASVYAYTGTGYKIAGYATKGGWSGDVADVNQALNKGGGVFVKVTSPATLTMVGNVMQGTLAKTYSPGFTLIGSQVPQSGTLASTLGFTPGSDTVTVYQFKADQSGYNVSGYATKGGWSPAEPTIGVSEGFWLKSTTGGTWTRNFSVQ